MRANFFRVGRRPTRCRPDEEPIDDHLAEDPDIAFEWLYLFTDQQKLRVFANRPGNQHGRCWTPFVTFPVSKLATVTADEITRRLHARR